MKISLATNFDDALIDAIKEYPIYEVYGKMTNDFISGGGRPSSTVGTISYEMLTRHVKKVREADIKFNYLLNGSCTSNVEQDTTWQNHFKEFLNDLKNIGVNALTISNPFLVQYVKKYFPDDFMIRISTFACIDSLEKAQYWENFGADILCVDFTKINRDFKTLKNMVDGLKKSRIEILVTNSCLKNCPMIYTHTNSLSHASQRTDREKLYEDWGLLYCQKQELLHIEQYIKSPWVRPEDIKYYENIGIEHFKITERGFPTKELVKRVRAYSERKYDGNLLDLIQGHGVEEKQSLEKAPIRKKLINRTDIYEEIKRVRGLGQKREFERHIYIDNNKLEGFLEHFVQGKCNGKCEECQYCLNIANKVISKNDSVYSYLLELYEKFDEIKF